jgi:ribonuclease Z
MEFEITILGSSSATPVYQRHPTAQIVQIHERFFLVDCGEGTLIQMNRFRIRFHRINHVFISHLHGDHYLGLMGLLSTMHLQGRTNPLHIYSPSGLQEIIEIQLHHSATGLRFPVHYHVLDTTVAEKIYEDDGVRVTTIPLNHRIPCAGFLFEELPRPRKLNKSALQQLNIPVSQFNALKEGKDITLADGTTVRNSHVTADPLPARRYAFCSDTIYEEELIRQISGVDVLYHEATFLHDMAERAAETFHTTALQAGRLARLAGVRQLIIGHFSARYKTIVPLLEEARTEFENTLLAVEGERYSL